MADLIEHARKMSDALLKVRPLGGSEMFTRVGGEFYADADFCGAEIDRLRSDLHEARKTAAMDRKKYAAEIERLIEVNVELQEQVRGMGQALTVLMGNND